MLDTADYGSFGMAELSLVVSAFLAWCDKLATLFASISQNGYEYQTNPHQPRPADPAAF